jgi:hypothetical protein
MLEELLGTAPGNSMLACRFWAFLDSLGALDGSDLAAADALETYVRRLQSLASLEHGGLTEAQQWHQQN